MTTDDFTTAARADAEQRYPDDTGLRSHAPHNVAMSSARAGFVRGWVAARDHLAAQEETEEEVEAAARALLVAALGYDAPDWDRLAEERRNIWRDQARAALAAARAVRQEKR